jgi:hypothetical protein
MQYHLKAHLLCHDVRLSNWIETVVDLDEAPGLAEAERLLWPVADTLVAQNGCEGCGYELSAVSIVPELGEV